MRLLRGLCSSATAKLGLLAFLLVFENVAFLKYSYIPIYDTTQVFFSGLTSASWWPLDSIWNPQIAGGIDTATAGYLTFVNKLLFHLLPGWAAYELVILFVHVVAVFSAFSIARNQFGLRDIPALFAAGLVGACVTSTLVQTHMGVVPGLIDAVDRVRRHPRSLVAWAWLAVLAGIVSQVPFFSFALPFMPLMLVGWYILMWRPDRGATTALAVAAAAAAVVTAVRFDEMQVLRALLPLGQFSETRVCGPWRGGIFRFVTVGSNPFYHSMAIATLAALAAIPAALRCAGAPRRLLAVLVACLLAAGLASWAQASLCPDYPVLGAIRLTKAALLLQLLMIMLAAFGVQALLADGGRRGRLVMVVLVVAAAADLAVGRARNLATDWLLNGNWVSNFESPVLREVAALAHADGDALVEPIHLFPGHLHAYGMSTFGGDSPVISGRWYRLWKLVTGRFLVNAERLQLTVFGSAAADSLALRPMDEFYRMNLLSLTGVRYFVSREPLVGRALEPLRETSVSWATRPALDKIAVRLRENLAGRGELAVYRNRDAFRRVFSPGALATYPDRAALLAALAAAPLDLLAAAVFVEAGEIPSVPGGADGLVSLAVRDYRIGAGEIEVTLDAAVMTEDRSGLLVISQAWMPGWRCTADGVAAIVFPADHALIGAVVPASSQRVECRYTRG